MPCQVDGQRPPGGCMRTCSSGPVPRKLGKRSYAQGRRNVVCFSQWVGFNRTSTRRPWENPIPYGSFRLRFRLKHPETNQLIQVVVSFARTWHNVPLPLKRGRSLVQNMRSSPFRAAMSPRQQPEVWARTPGVDYNLGDLLALRQVLQCTAL